MVWLSSAYDFPFLFAFCFGDDKGDDLLFGFFFLSFFLSFLFPGGDQEDSDVNVGIRSFLLVFVSIFALCTVFCLCFLSFFFLAPRCFSPVLSLAVM